VGEEDRHPFLFQPDGRTPQKLKHNYIVSHFFWLVNPPTKTLGKFLFGGSPLELTSDQDGVAAALKAGLHDKLTGLTA